MLQFFKKILSFLFILIFLNACVSSGKNYFNNAKEKLINSNNSDSDVGEIFKEENDNQVEQYNETFNPTRKLNIIIPAFDPGIKDNKEVFLGFPSEITGSTSRWNRVTILSPSHGVTAPEGWVEAKNLNFDAVDLFEKAAQRDYWFWRDHDEEEK